MGENDVSLAFGGPFRFASCAGLAALSLSTALAQIPDLGTGHVPTLAPLVKEVTPAVVNISVQGKIREDNAHSGRPASPSDH